MNIKPIFQFESTKNISKLNKENYPYSFTSIKNVNSDDIILDDSIAAKKLLSNVSALLANESNFNKDDLLFVFDEIKNLSPKAKKMFIKQYCIETGFPSIELTSEKIENDITNALIKTQDKTGINVLLAGYNPTCSVANGHALPGSDIDTFFICLEKGADKNKFKSEFKKNTNPLLVSMTWNRTSDLPDIVTIDEIENSLLLADSEFIKNGLAKKSDKYEQILSIQNEDWTKAGEYNLDLNQFISDEDKTPLLRAGLLMEIMRDGTVLVNSLPSETQSFMENSATYKYSNMQQMGSFKTAPLKQKHKNREELLSDFNNLSTDEKLDMILNIIKISVKDLKNDVPIEYFSMFKDSGCGNMEDMIQPLLSNRHRLDEYKTQ